MIWIQDYKLHIKVIKNINKNGLYTVREYINHFYYYKSIDMIFTIKGARKTVRSPAIPIDKELIAPSISPSSIAFVVPIAWAAVPRETPLDILCLTLNVLNTTSPIIDPKIPVNIIATTVMEGIPFRVLLISTPIGVVTDLGASEFAI